MSRVRVVEEFSEFLRVDGGSFAEQGLEHFFVALLMEKFFHRFSLHVVVLVNDGVQ